jgi:puromycin-sensitive aminopeptidase
MFDTLTYTKGASVLRMLERYLGAERFREGIRRYLADHAHGNTETSDLWDGIEAVTGEPVGRIMDTWIWQGGFPLVSASSRDGSLRLEQGRFRFDGVPDESRWEVPLLVRHGSARDGTVEPVLVGDGGATIALRDDAPAVVNAGGHAFVRVRYAPELRDRLAGSLSDLTAVERYQLVDDAWAATVAGVLTGPEFCDLVRAFSDETDLPVWQAILLGLAWCERVLDGAPRERFRSFVRGQVRPALDRVGWEAREDDPDLTKALRGALFSGLGALGGDPEVLALAREIELEARSGAADPSLATAALSVIASVGGPEEFDAFLAARKAAPTPQEELRYLVALPEFRDPALLGRALRLAETDAVRPQNAPQFYARALANRDQGPLAWSYVRDRWDEMVGRLAPSTVIFVAYGLRALVDPASVEDVQGFFATHDIPQSALQLRQTLETQRVNAAFAARARGELEARFSD